MENPKYFRGQQPEEKFVCFFRHHWFSLLKDFLYFGFLVTAFVLLISNFDMITSELRTSSAMRMLFLLGFAMGTIYMHRFFYKLFTLFVDVGIVTDMRLIDHQKTLLFVDTMDSIDMGQIQDIEKVESGLLPKLFGYGHVHIFLTASASMKAFHDVPNPAFLFTTITIQKENRQYKQLREQGGLKKEEEGEEVNSAVSKVQAEAVVEVERAAI